MWLEDESKGFLTPSLDGIAVNRMFCSKAGLHNKRSRIPTSPFPVCVHIIWTVPMPHIPQVTGAVTFPTCSEYTRSLVPGEPVARSHWSDRLAGENQSVYRSVVCSV